MTPVLKGVLTDLGFDNAVDGAAGVRRPRLHRGTGHVAVRARRPHRHDLRGRQRHPGARPRRPQARRKDGGRAVMAFFNEVGAFCQENAGDEALKPYRRAAASRRSATCSRRPCGSCRTPWRSPTMPAPAPPTTCTSSASSRWAICGRGWPRRRRRRRRGRRRAPTMDAKLVDRPLLHGAHAAGDRRCVWPASQAGADAVMALPAESVLSERHPDARCATGLAGADRRYLETGARSPMTEAAQWPTPSSTTPSAPRAAAASPTARCTR